jgi:hypothetical protein
VTVGRFTQRAHHYATKAMQLTDFQVYLMNSHDLRTIASEERTLKDILRRQAWQARTAKGIQVAQLHT